MKRNANFVVGLIFQFALTIFAAWLGTKWIQGFDIRGPFLLMSPAFAALIFFTIDRFKIFRDFYEEEGTPKSADLDLVKEVTVEFGFGPVAVSQRRVGPDLVLFFVPGDGNPYALPKNWNDFDEDARRFAVVRILSQKMEPLASRYAKNWPYHLCQLLAMLVAGLNLWTIFGIHAATAIWFAFLVFFQREKLVTRQDIAALRVMKDLNAAISFARVDHTNSALGVTPSQRIAALTKEATRLGIA